jgi:hypothetical protein
MIVFRYLDLLLLVMALPVFLLGELPTLGYVAGGGAWLVQRAIQVGLGHRYGSSKDPRAVLAVAVGGTMGRAWLVALTIFAAGVSDHRAGLAAAVLVIALFTVYFTVSMLLRPFEQRPEATP